MSTHAYAYPRRRRVVPKAREHLVSKIMSTLTQITANAASYSRRTDPTVIRLDHYTRCMYNSESSDNGFLAALVLPALS